MESYEVPSSDPEHTAYAVTFNGEELIFHWFNTRLRLFKDEQFNHVEYRDEEDQLKGIETSKSFMDFLFDHDFPYQFDPIVDEMTLEWFVNVEMRDINEPPLEEV